MFETGKIKKAETYCSIAEKCGDKTAAEAYVLRLKNCLTGNVDDESAIRIYREALSINGIRENTEFRKIEAALDERFP